MYAERRGDWLIFSGSFFLLCEHARGSFGELLSNFFKALMSNHSYRDEAKIDDDILPECHNKDWWLSGYWPLINKWRWQSLCWFVMEPILRIIRKRGAFLDILSSSRRRANSRVLDAQKCTPKSRGERQLSRLCAELSGFHLSIRGHPFLTFAKFSGFWTPPPLVRNQG